MCKYSHTYLDAICVMLLFAVGGITIETQPAIGGVSSTINSFEFDSTVNPTKSLARTTATYPLACIKSRPGSIKQSDLIFVSEKLKNEVFVPKIN